MQPNPNSSTPLYIQIKELLVGQIRAGHFAVGDRLPSERELSERYTVARMTARQALQLLQQDGLTHRQVGKGTYVARPQVDQARRDLTSFTTEMAARGLPVYSRVLRAELQPADPDIAGQLGTAAGESTVVLQRIRCAGDKPIALETAYLLHRTCPGILGAHNFAHTSLYQVLQDVYGIHLVWASQVIGARMPDRFERDALDLPKRVPVLGVLRVTYDAADRPIEFVRSCYHSERFQLRAQLGLAPTRTR